MGIINVSIGYLAFSFFIYICGLGVWSSNFIASLIVISLGYSLSKVFVFKISKSNNFVLYCISFASQYFVFTFLIAWLVEIGVSPSLSWLSVAPVASLASFLIQKHIIFR